MAFSPKLSVLSPVRPQTENDGRNSNFSTQTAKLGNILTLKPMKTIRKNKKNCAKKKTFSTCLAGFFWCVKSET